MTTAYFYEPDGTRVDFTPYFASPIDFDFETTAVSLSAEARRIFQHADSWRWLAGPIRDAIRRDNQLTPAEQAAKHEALVWHIGRLRTEQEA